MEFARFVPKAAKTNFPPKNDFHHKFVPEAVQLRLKLFHLGAHITKLSLVVHVLDLIRGRNPCEKGDRATYVSGLVSESHSQPQSSSSTDGRTQAI